MTTRFRALDGLRGVLAFVVLVIHTPIITGHTIFWHGYLAVDFFFLLSGFVISEAYEKKLLQGTLSAGNFMVQRAIRLYPMIVVGVLLGAAAVLAVSHEPVSRIIMATASALFLVPYSWFDVAGGPHLWPVDPPTWSLFFEVLSNIAFAVILYRLSTRWLLGPLVIALIGVAVAAFYYDSLCVGFYANDIWAGFSRVVFGFVAGMIWNRLHHLNRLPKWRLNMWLLTILTLLVLAIQPRYFIGGSDLVIVLFVFPFILILGMNSEATSSIWTWSGRLSYPLYLVHYPVIQFISGEFHPESAFQRAVTLAATIGICLFLATCASIMFDEPLRAKLTAQLRKRRDISTALRATPQPRTESGPSPS